jgi:DnaJ-class molecular chaperone
MIDMDELCHACGGTGKDSIAVASSSYSDRCSNCNGIGIEPIEEDEEEF